MSDFREIRPIQTIIPVKKPLESAERKQERQNKGKQKKEQQHDKDDDHKVDEFI